MPQTFVKVSGSGFVTPFAEIVRPPTQPTHRECAGPGWRGAQLHWHHGGEIVKPRAELAGRIPGPVRREEGPPPQSLLASVPPPMAPLLDKGDNFKCKLLQSALSGNRAELLHTYNEIKDVAQTTLGVIATRRSCSLAQLYHMLGIDSEM
jgi:hypothetical protein